MSSEAYLQKYFDVFAARDDVYAIGKPKPTDDSKYAYFKVHEPWTLDVARQHLQGKLQVGVYPIVNDRVKWFAIDFDAPKGKRRDADIFEVIWDEAIQQHQAMRDAGVISYLERSRSGTGVHLWVFFEEWLSAAQVRRAFRPLLRQSIAFDRIYPVQDEVPEGGFGNLLALPFNGTAVNRGNSVFLDPDTREPIKPSGWLDDLQFTSASLVEALAAAAPALANPETPQQADMVEGERANSLEATFDGRPATPLTGWLKVISPFGCKAMRYAWTNRHECPEPLWYAMIQQATCFEQGRQIAHIMSQGYAGYNPREVNDKYDHALQNPPVGCQYIHDNFPQHACPGCPRTAPYHIAKRSMTELTQQADPLMQRGGFGAFRERITTIDTVGTPGFTLGHDTLDRTFLFRPSELTVIGSPPNMGKSAKGVDVSIRIARKGVHTFWHSAEMGEVGLRSRMIAHVANIDSRALRGERLDPITDRRLKLSRDEWARVDAAIEELDQLPIYLDFSANEPEQMLKAQERVLLKYGIAFDAPVLWVHDYLQYGIVPPGETIESRTSRVSAELKASTKISGFAGLTFAQLVRAAEGQQTPQLTWFKGSGRIEADVDNAFIITGERAQGLEVNRSLWLLKQREGDVGIRFDFTLYKHTSRWEERVPLAGHVTPFNLPSDA